MISEIASRFCPTTLALNIGAIGISFTDVEFIIKIASYSVALIWTTLRIIKEIKDWNIKKK